MTKLDDEYRNLRHKIDEIEEQQMKNRRIKRKLSDLNQEMSQCLHRTMRDIDQILNESIKSRYAYKLNNEYNSLIQDRNRILGRIDDQLQMTESTIRHTETEIDDLYQDKSKIFQEMKEKGEL
ncbi:MAG TPA: hypothetical protein H9918_03270 [Candidatus Ligilactobacillus faecavium]|nr:hypothetical protein [Candidatus Ligilactobacillus faecavium]